MRKAFTKMFIGLLLINLSCNGDDDSPERATEENLPAHFTFDQKGYHGQSRLVVDYAWYFNHRDYVFSMIDTKNYNWEKDPTEAKFELILDVYSPGPERFHSGTFNFINFEIDDDWAAVEGLFFFNYASIQIDSNNDGKLTEIDPIYYAVGGTITIQKAEASHRYTITLDITMDNGKKITGEFTENWVYIH